MISQSEPTPPKEILVKKIRTDLSVFSVVPEASVTLEKRISRKKRKIKSLAMLPPRKDPIINQDINIVGTKKDRSLPPQLPKFLPGYKSLRNKADDDRNYYTDKSHTDKEYYIDNLKSTD